MPTNRTTHNTERSRQAERRRQKLLAHGATAEQAAAMSTWTLTMTRRGTRGRIVKNSKVGGKQTAWLTRAECLLFGLSAGAGNK